MTETKRFFWPRAERKLSFHVENHVLDSLLAICFHSSQKMAFVASNCCFPQICQESMGWCKMVRVYNELRSFRSMTISFFFYILLIFFPSLQVLLK